MQRHQGDITTCNSWRLSDTLHLLASGPSLPTTPSSSCVPALNTLLNSGPHLYRRRGGLSACLTGRSGEVVGNPVQLGKLPTDYAVTKVVYIECVYVGRLTMIIHGRARSIKLPGCQWLQIPSFGDQKYHMAFYFGTGIVHTLKLG